MRKNFFFFSNFSFFFDFLTFLKVKLAEAAKSLGKTLMQTARALKMLHMEGRITMEIEEELIDVKFFGPIEKRMIEVSKKVYMRMLKEFYLEKSLLEFMYAVFINGSSTGNNFFNAKNKKRLSQILKAYAFADEKGIPKIFEKNTFDIMLAPMRGTKKDHEEITAVFYYLLKENRDVFLKNEIGLCRGEGGPIAGEYVTQCIVKTMCGKPPKKVSLFDLSIRNSNIEFSKMDFLLLLKLAEKVLAHYLKTTSG